MMNPYSRYIFERHVIDMRKTAEEVRRAKLARATRPRPFRRRVSRALMAAAEALNR
ncbi:MAG TPA: hypothetical protein VFE42_10600 [Chloroflexota bacterium]|nr:hypothetical protein [Chloroflexota bacterium]